MSCRRYFFRNVASSVLSRDILQGIRLRLALYRPRTSRIYDLLSRPVRPRNLCQLDRLESSSSLQVRRLGELFATLERPELLELYAGNTVLRSLQHTVSDADRFVVIHGDINKCEIF